MAKAKRYEVRHAFAGEIKGQRVWFTRRNQQDVALLDGDTLADCLERGTVVEYEADDAVMDAEAALAAAMPTTSVPMAMREEQEGTARGKKKAAAKKAD